jgi:hypothetical protein
VVCSGPNSDDKHPEADVQDIDVSYSFQIFTYLLITSIRKKAGASDQLDGRGSGVGCMGMMTSMKERAKLALQGRTGDTDNEDD